MPGNPASPRREVRGDRVPARSAPAGHQFDSRRGIERWDIWARRNSVCRKWQCRKPEPAKKADDCDTHINLLKVKSPSSLDSSMPPRYALTAVNWISRPTVSDTSGADRDQVVDADDPRCRPGHPLGLLALGP